MNNAERKNNKPEEFNQNNRVCTSNEKRRENQTKQVLVLHQDNRKFTLKLYVVVGWWFFILSDTSQSRKDPINKKNIYVAERERV